MKNPESGEKREISRRRMLASLGSLVAFSALGSNKTYTSYMTKEDEQPRTNFSLTGKSAIVTGCARGIGRAIAVALAAEGADIMGIDIAGPVSSEVIYPAATEKDLEETQRQ